MCSLKVKQTNIQKKDTYYSSFPQSQKLMGIQGFKENDWIFGYGVARVNWGVVNKGRGKIIMIFWC